MTPNKYYMNEADKEKSQECERCVRTKQVRTKCTGKLETGSPDLPIHTDIYEPIQPSILREQKSILTLISVRHRYTRVYLLRQRNKIADLWHYFISWFGWSTNKRGERFYPDNGEEFPALRESLNDINITLTTWSAYTPQWNGQAERMNRTLKRKMLDMINEAHLVLRFSVKAIVHVADVHNSTVSAVLSKKTPIKMFMGIAPDS